MFSKNMGRRNFLKKMSSAIFGVVGSHFWSGLPFANAEKKPALEFRTLGKTGLKVTAVSMGVMNCSDPAVLQRAFDLGINFYDTADCYMRGRNEEMVGKAFEGRRQKVFIQTKVHAHDEKKMRASVERSLRRLRTDYIDVLVWHGHSWNGRGYILVRQHIFEGGLMRGEPSHPLFLVTPCLCLHRHNADP